MQEIQDRSDRDASTFKLLTEENRDVMKELSELKETYQKQCDVFVYEVNRCNKLINDHAHELTMKTQSLDNIAGKHKEKLDMAASNLKELYGRVNMAETNISRHESEIQLLKTHKVDDTTFAKT